MIFKANLKGENRFIPWYLLLWKDCYGLTIFKDEAQESFGLNHILLVHTDTSVGVLNQSLQKDTVRKLIVVRLCIIFNVEYLQVHNVCLILYLEC